jgi:hypothetical protein
MSRIGEFFAGLVGTNDELNMLYNNHLVEYDELLPHVFMGDMTRYVMKLAISSTIGEKEREVELKRILDYFENAIHGPDEEINNLLVVSFLENLEQSHQSYNIIKSRLGKELRKSLDQLETFSS